MNESQKDNGNLTVGYNNASGSRLRFTTPHPDSFDFQYARARLFRDVSKTRISSTILDNQSKRSKFYVYNKKQA